jgi:hypothetical protein
MFATIFRRGQKLKMLRPKGFARVFNSPAFPLHWVVGHRGFFK